MLRKKSGINNSKLNVDGTDTKLKRKAITAKNLAMVVLFACVIYVFGLGLSLVIRRILTLESGALPYDSGNLSSVTGMISSAITSVSVAFALIAFNRSNDAKEKEVRLHEAEFYRKFVERWLETDKYIMQHHRVRKYLYDMDADITELLKSGVPEDEDKYHEAMCLCEYLEDFAIYLDTEIKKDTDSGNRSIASEQVESYENYIKKLKASSAFREYHEKYAWINDDASKHFSTD